MDVRNGFADSVGNTPLIRLAFSASLAWTHNRVEGKQKYIQLLYLRSRAPFDLWDRKARHGVKLYVQNVLRSSWRASK